MLILTFHHHPLHTQFHLILPGFFKNHVCLMKIVLFFIC